MNDTLVNSVEVKSFNESGHVNWSGLTSVLFGILREAGCQNVNQCDEFCKIFCANVCTSNTDNLCSISSCTVKKLNSVDPQGAMHSDVHHTAHSIVPHMETIPYIPLIPHNATS